MADTTIRDGSRFVNADLHCHSNVSDGLLTPSELAQRAFNQGVEIWSLTDHDEIGGQVEAKAAAQRLGMNFVTGVEISVTWARETIHIVGLQIDAENAALVQGLQKTRAGRTHRGQEMGAELDRVGIHGAYQGALRFVDNPELISRTHFARHLVDQGICHDVRDVFQRYLVEGRPGYVPMKWASLGDAMNWIVAANGVPVLAHPGRYHLSDLEMDVLIEEFKERGGRGIEVVTGSHTVDQYQLFARRACQSELLASRGSDFHGPGESRVDLGALPPLPDSVTPIWNDWFKAG